MTATVYADTSLLVSLYLADANTPAALAAVTTAAQPLILTTWQQFELENALQLRLFRRESTRADLNAAEASLTADLAAGIVVATNLPVASVLPLARQLTARHTALVGTRAFGVFHVAAALHLKATRFLSFDTRQLALARAAGLRTA
jgi:hypothetical protein